jgi:hypothetical protein
MSELLLEISKVEAMVAAQPEQRTQEWRDERVGKFTASEIYRLLTPVYEKRKLTEEELKQRPKTGEGSRTTMVEVEVIHKLAKGAITYVQEKVAEHFTGVAKVSESRATMWGTEIEPLAKEHYKAKTGRPILPAYFVPLSKVSGGTPDGYTTDEPLLYNSPNENYIFMRNMKETFNADTAEILCEIKCPYESYNMIKYWQMDLATFKEDHYDYYCQIQFNMMVTKKKKGRMIFFDPRQPEWLQMCILDIPEDLELQDYMVKKILAAEKMKRAIISEIEFKAELQFQYFQ